MNRFLIVTNDGKDTDYKVTNKIKKTIKRYRYECDGDCDENGF